MVEVAVAGCTVDWKGDVAMETEVAAELCDGLTDEATEWSHLSASGTLSGDSVGPCHGFDDEDTLTLVG